MRYLAYHENKTHGTFDFPMNSYTVYGYRTTFHWHHEHELVYVHSGRVTVSSDGEEIKLSSGEVAYISDGIIHGYEPLNAVYTCIVFDFDRLIKPTLTSNARYSQIFSDTKQIQNRFDADSGVSLTVAELCRILDEKRSGYELRAVALTLNLYANIIESGLYHTLSEDEIHSRKKVHRIKSVLKLIQENYAEPLTLADLSGEAGMSPEYFCRVFKAVIGRSPIDYLNYYRLQCATEKLRTTDEYVTDIALSCGFADLSYFSKVFKKYNGISAGEYRRRNTSETQMK